MLSGPPSTLPFHTEEAADKGESTFRLETTSEVDRQACLHKPSLDDYDKLWLHSFGLLNLGNDSAEVSLQSAM